MVIAQHGDTDQLLGMRRQEVPWEAHGLPAEDETVTVGPGHLGVPPGALGAEEPEPLCGIPGQEVIPVIVVGRFQLFPVVQPGPAQVVVRGLEARGWMRCRFAPLFTQSRPMLPVFCGISGWCKMMWNMGGPR